MKTKKYFMAMLLAATTFLFSCDENKSNSDNTATEQNTEQNIYQCPMKCEGEKTYDKPGQCPKCGMDLEKVETDASEENHEGHQH